MKGQVRARRISCLAVLIATGTISSQTPQNNDFEGMMNSIQKVLPEGSALPPVTQLSLEDMHLPSERRAWEDKWQNVLGMNRRIIDDPGVNPPSTPASVATTIIEQVGGSALPARSSSVIVIGRVTSAESHLAENKHLVYVRYTINVEQVLKPKKFARSSPSLELLEAGGALRFPSGHVEYFIIAHDGFLQKGKQYLLFLWKSVPGMKEFEGTAYLLDNGVAFPIEVSIRDAFKGKPVSELLARTRAAIAANVDR